MFPGYVYLYKDDDGFVHLLFYPGFTDDNTNYYQDLNINLAMFTYTKTQNPDGLIDYKFNNKLIIEISCNLVRYDNKIIKKIVRL